MNYNLKPGFVQNKNVQTIAADQLLVLRKLVLLIGTHNTAQLLRDLATKIERL